MNPSLNLLLSFLVFMILTIRKPLALFEVKMKEKVTFPVIICGLTYGHFYQNLVGNLQDLQPW